MASFRKFIIPGGRNGHITEPGGLTFVQNWKPPALNLLTAQAPTPLPVTLARDSPVAGSLVTIVTGNLGRAPVHVVRGHDVTSRDSEDGAGTRDAAWGVVEGAV